MKFPHHHICARILLIASFLIATSASANEAALKKMIEAAYPKFTVDSISKTPYAGLYEVYIGGQLIYTDEKFSFLIVDGRVVDPKSKKDMTSERLNELNKIDFASLPLDLAVKVVKGNGSRKMAVFSDPDCPFCKRLEQNELVDLTDVTIYTFLLPLDQLHPDAANKAKQIWCSPDRAKAWQDWVMQGTLPKKTNTCDVPLDKIAAVAKKYAVSSTPTIFFADGKRMTGAYPAAEIEKALGKK
ncbi:MAG: DsbC family protein [Candidatus Methylopumilus sp.]|jgi:thiol:disulfide interchange protein DsbC|nr:DsbC family protein [Candidatus Methylopumilus sp.]